MQSPDYWLFVDNFFELKKRTAYFTEFGVFFCPGSSEFGLAVRMTEIVADDEGNAQEFFLESMGDGEPPDGIADRFDGTVVVEAPGIPGNPQVSRHPPHTCGAQGAAQSISATEAGYGIGYRRPCRVKGEFFKGKAGANLIGFTLRVADMPVAAGEKGLRRTLQRGQQFFNSVRRQTVIKIKIHDVLGAYQ